jgi:hypothetical protein
MFPVRPARLPLAAAIVCALPLPAAAAPVVQVDGRLDEAIWLEAERHDDFVVTEPYTLAKPSFPTTAWIVGTPEGIAVAFRAVQPPGAPRTRERTPRDADQRGDRVNVFIDFNADGETAYNFTVALSGAVQDATITNETAYSTDWDGDWRHAVSEGADDWTVEMLIPWTVAPMRDSNAPTREIAVQFDRVYGATAERSAWPAASYTRPRWVSEFAKLSIDQYQDSALYFYPYATAAYDFLGRDGDGKAGMDVFWKPSGDFQLTAALNPDFGQVEADELVVNFDAIEAFFSDRRPFFTENQSLFDLRTPDSGLLIYTRRIGGPADDGSGRAAEIDAAVKLNGSVRGYDYGVLAAQEADHADGIGSLFHAQRLLHAAGDTTWGYLGTHAERPFLDRRADVHAVDGTWRPSAELGLTGQVIASRTDQAGVVRDGRGAWLRADYTPDTAWRHELEVAHFDAALDFNDMGFQRRASLNEAEYTAQWQQNIDDATSPLRGINWRGELQYRTNDRGVTLPGALFIDIVRQYRDGGELQLGFGGEFAGTNDLISRGNGDVRLPARPYAYIEYDTPRLGGFEADFSLARQSEGLGGPRWALYAEATHAFSDTLSLNAELEYIDSSDWLIWERDTLFGRYARQSTSTALNLDWFPAPHHEVRAKLQWLGIDAENGRGLRRAADGQLRASGEALDDFTVSNLGLQLRYRWEFRPQSDFFVVYGRGGFIEETGSADDLLDLVTDARRLRDADQVVVKLRYRF